MFRNIAICLALVAFSVAATPVAQAGDYGEERMEVAGIDCWPSNGPLDRSLQSQILVEEETDIAQGKTFYSLQTACGNRYWRVQFDAIPIEIRPITNWSGAYDVVFKQLPVTITIRNRSFGDEEFPMFLPVRTNFFVWVETSLAGKMLVEAFLAGTPVRIEGNIEIPIARWRRFTREEMEKEIGGIMNPMLSVDRINGVDVR